MGLFDRKRSADPESEPEHTPAPAPAAQAAPAKPAATTTKAAAEPTKAKAKPAEPAKPTYGIQNAIELMRQLPEDNVPLVVEVVKKTLESLNVDIGSIIGDAERKHARIDERVDNLQVEIRDFEDEIAARRKEIEALTADRDETKIVKERLELAQQGGVVVRPSSSTPTATATAVPKPKPAEPAKPATPDTASGNIESASASSSWGSTRASGTLPVSKQG